MTRYRGNKYSSKIQFLITISAVAFANNQAKNGQIVSVSGNLYILIRSGIAARKSANTANIIANNALSVIPHNTSANRANAKQK